MRIDNDILLIVIDSFCGAGGVTEGFHRAELNGKKIAKVVIGINHDKIAIESHAANHPETYHFIEDFSTLDPNKLVSIIDESRILYPNAKVLFWASAECTHHSKAKGGLPRDADSRSLPEHIERYAVVLKPDIIGIENVREFMDWGPLNAAGKPIKFLKKSLFNWWKFSLQRHGYYYDDELLNAADYGAYTSRIRYFGIFSRKEENISFPEQTHSRNGGNGFEKWKAVKDVLKLDKEGESIFSRKKPLVDATLLRIIYGVEEFVIKGKDNFLLKYNSMNQQKKCKCPSVENPSPVVSCQGRIALVKTKFASMAYSGRPKDKNFTLDRPAMTVTTRDHHQMLTVYYGNGYNQSIEEPSPTITTKDRCGLITSKFLSQYNSGNDKNRNKSVNYPCGVITTNNRFSLVTAKFIQSYYSGGGKIASLHNPAQTIMTTPKQNLVSCQWLMDTQFSNAGQKLDRPCKTVTANRKHFYLMNPQFRSKGSSIHKPCFTLIARMDKMPPYLIQTVEGDILIKINPEDSETMVQLKNLCNEHGIIDILMRMLFIEELKRIMGFGDDYVLKGTKADMKKFIGNAVECNQAKVLAEAIGMTVLKEHKLNPATIAYLKQNA